MILKFFPLFFSPLLCKTVRLSFSFFSSFLCRRSLFSLSLSLFHSFSFLSFVLLSVFFRF